MAVQYVTTQDVLAALPRDPNRPGDNLPERFDKTEVSSAIDLAQGEVEGKTGRVYSDASTVPLILKGIIVDIAAYILAYRFLPGTAEIVTNVEGTMGTAEPVLLRYQRAEALLADIMAGSIVLPPPPDGVGSAAFAIAINPYQGELFSMCEFNLGVDRRGF